MEIQLNKDNFEIVLLNENSKINTFLYMDDDDTALLVRCDTYANSEQPLKI